jgi:hypothetical protein
LEKAKLEGMLAGVLRSIDFKEGDLDQELVIMLRNKKMNDDDLKFVGLIRDAIGYREDIKNIDVYFYINNNLKGIDQAG